MADTDVIEAIMGRQVRHAPCMVCGNADHDVLWTKDQFQYVRCSGCRSVRVDPQLLMSEVARIYSIGYRNKQGLQPASQTASPYHKGLLKQMSPYRQAGCILDVGCFTGKFLSAAKEAGWRPYGLEISTEAVEYARNRLDLDVRQETLLLTTLESGTFDAITMFDVVEHFQEPLLNLKAAAQLLRPNGLLYIETPNFSSLARHLLGKDWSVFFPWHFYYFTARTIGHVLERAGFRVVKIQAVDLGPLSRFNAMRGIENGGSISEQNIAKRLKNRGFVNAHPGPFRAAYHFARDIENISFKGMSRLGIHLGGKLVVWAERI
jgi:2-polyprenyl-3-methyl-5-hydroxy-6-metoxy-1,4-benzoquinol methylase